MKATTFPSTHAELHMASEPCHYPYAEYTAELQDLFSHSMDRALGIQKASLDAVVKMQAEVFEMQKHISESEPVLSNFADMTSQTLATCLEIQMTWLNLMVSCAQQGMEMWLQLVGMGVILASGQEHPEPISINRASRTAAA